MTSSKVKFYSALLAIVAITAGPAVYLGHRQVEQAALLGKAAQRLSLIPDQFGAWTLRDEDTLSETVLQILGCSTYVCRNYVHKESGETVALVVLAGPAGPLAVHTPEICMTSREYENLKPSVPIEIAAPGGPHCFFETFFRAKTLEGQKLNVYYGWSRDGKEWEAPASPRIALGPLPMLYKLQVASAESTTTVGGKTAGVAFLTDLLPLLAQSNLATN